MVTLEDSVAKTAPLTAADLALVKIHGSKFGYASFGKTMRGNFVVVDKTLVCKAKLADELDPELARAERMKLFKATLLYQQAPAFFAQHFGSYPLAIPLLNAAYYWIRAFASKQLDGTQREQLDKLTEMHKELEGYADAPGTLFACLSEFVASVCQSRCIVLVDAYDKPFGYAKDKPWSDHVQRAYIALLKQILDSSLLSKAMFAGNYAVPLEVDSKDILDVVPATYNCRQIQLTAEPGSEYTLGAMVVMLASHLISGFDHGEPSCFIWPSLQLKDNNCASAADATHNFVLDPLVYPDAVRTEASIDSFVSLTLYLGYLTVGVDNSLRIPNNGMRDLWEQIRLMATFGTWDQIQQDIAQHQLIDSLFSGKASVVRDDFESALKQLSSDCDSYSDAARLELACRYVASGLTLSKYAATKNQVNVVYDYQFLLKPQFGKTWAIELLPFGRYNQRLVVLFHFASGRSENAASSADAFEQLAIDSLNTIVDNGDVQPFAHCDVRLDLGVAFGNETVIVKQRLWKRISDDQMDTSES
ncbi:hypothetical protein IWW51_003958, partial [Coemansia sp. RSA 2702]